MAVLAPRPPAQAHFVEHFVEHPMEHAAEEHFMQEHVEALYVEHFEETLPRPAGAGLADEPAGEPGHGGHVDVEP
eukprot:6915608-Lingulodinium_polyedra.AAC.1